MVTVQVIILDLMRCSCQKAALPARGDVLIKTLTNIRRNCPLSMKKKKNGLKEIINY